VIVCFVDVSVIDDQHCLMVNNSTHINKTNNHISPKESLSSDDQQFHPYQQNKQSHFTKGKFIVCFVDMGGIVDHHCLNFPLVKCDCLFC
jgi:hypothetical protein